MESSGGPNGSPTPRRTFTNRSHENAIIDDDKMQYRMDANSMMKKTATALSTSKLINQPAKTKNSTIDTQNPMDKLLAKLSEQQATLKQRDAPQMTDGNAQEHVYQNSELVSESTSKAVSYKSSSSVAVSTNTSHDSTSVAESPNAGQPSRSEILRLKIELEKARGKIAMMDQELTQTRITKHTVEQAIGGVADGDYIAPQPIGPTDPRLGTMPSGMSMPMRSQYPADASWVGQDDGRSDTSDVRSVSNFYQAGGSQIWGASGRTPYNNYATGLSGYQNGNGFAGNGNGFAGNGWMGRGLGVPFHDDNAMAYQQGMSNRSTPDIDHSIGSMGTGRNNFRGRGGGYMGRNNSFPYASSNGSFDGMGHATYGSVAGMGGGVGNAMGGSMGMSGSYQPQPIGTPLSPFAPEFTSIGGQWKNDLNTVDGQTYLPTTEPLNYRRLLDRSVNCNWKYIVDKIVGHNDQQASIFLQQKLKVGTTEQKYDIVEAIVAQAYPLMVNRFGNFLVQRCFEHGTPEQVIKIAEAIRGNTLNLSMDAFGCHVVQKAFDSVPEDYKAIMVHELLRRIPETVIHRYACHVWQKLFELRWTESPPQIMKYVNEALRGMWHEVALGETGSLVVQNIFENCLEEDKRPCIEEVLASIDIVAHGQFGNWCIQHICEHGAPADRARAIDHVIRYASEYSMDQFASKVVEKCLKIGGVEFLSRYLDRVCEGRNDRPRIPLIDIASDQYGNYLIQYILTHANPQHREIVACHIRKHMVSLRGSKFGSRVGMLCTNPAIATRPGPGVGPAMGPGRMAPGNPRFGGAYR